jgi:chromosomal replication initiator protein
MKENYRQFWNEAMNQIRQELGEELYSWWFNLEYLQAADKTGKGRGVDSPEPQVEIRVAVQNAFMRDELMRRYQNLIEEKLLTIAGKKFKVIFEIKPEKSPPVIEKTEPVITDTNTSNLIYKTSSQKTDAKTTLSILPKEEKKGAHPQLRKDYTFDRYVIGENNRFAANAAMAIARNPGINYNPFLVYGGVGLGKTHLMQAIGNYIHEHANSKIIYITAEGFLNEFVDAIRDSKMTNGNKMPAFRNKFRYVDVLLIDDIQFLQKREGIQDELFFTFNALYDANRQLVFTCDRPVSELKQIQERLRNRFERGFNIDLQPPDYETRCAIMKSKIEEKGLNIPDEVIALVCKNISTNIRDLEAALTKLAGYLELVGKTITIEIAQQQLKDMFATPKHPNMTLETIQKVVAEYHSLSFNDLRGQKRTKNIVMPRQIAMYIAREITEFSTTEVGQSFGGRDHTTVMHSCQKIEEQLKTDPKLDAKIKELINMIKDYSIKS